MDRFPKEGPRKITGKEKKELQRTIDESGLLRAIKEDRNEAYQAVKSRGELQTFRVTNESMRRVLDLDRLHDQVRKIRDGKFKAGATFVETQRYLDMLLQKYGLTWSLLGDKDFKK